MSLDAWSPPGTEPVSPPWTGALTTGARPPGQPRRELGRVLSGAGRAVGDRLPRQLLRFAAIGILSTLAYLGLFALLRLGTGAQTANAIALATTAIANTAANRRLTFGVTGRRHAARHQLQGLLVLAFGLALTSGALAGLHAADPVPPRPVELAVVVLANLVGAVARFVALRAWMLHRRTDA